MFFSYAFHFDFFDRNFYRRDSRLIYELGSYVLANKNLKGQNAMYL